MSFVQISPEALGAALQEKISALEKQLDIRTCVDCNPELERVAGIQAQLDPLRLQLASIVNQINIDENLPRIESNGLSLSPTILFGLIIVGAIIILR